MNRYRVYVRGFVEVEAANAEEASTAVKSGKGAPAYTEASRVAQFVSGEWRLIREPAGRS